MALSGIPYATSFGDGFFVYSNNAYSGELINTTKSNSKMLYRYSQERRNASVSDLFFDLLLIALYDDGAFPSIIGDFDEIKDGNASSAYADDELFW